MSEESTHGRWQPDPERDGDEFVMLGGVRVSRPLGPRILSESPKDAPGIRLAMAMDPVEFTLAADGPFVEPCVDDGPHEFGKPWKCADPEEIGEECKRCKRNRYTKNGETVAWMEYVNYRAVFTHRFSFGGSE